MNIKHGSLNLAFYNSIGQLILLQILNQSYQQSLTYEPKSKGYKHVKLGYAKVFCVAKN